MDLIREALLTTAKVANSYLSEWVTEEVVEGEDCKTEIIRFKAKKLHNRAMKVYETTVEIKDDTYIFVKNPHGEFKFLKSDIANVELKKAFIFSIAYTVFPVLVGVLMLILGAIGLPVAAALFAIPFYTALIKTIKIKLKNGKTVKIYYTLKKDAEVLTAKLNV